MKGASQFNPLMLKCGLNYLKVKCFVTTTEKDWHIKKSITGY